MMSRGNTFAIIILKAVQKSISATGCTNGTINGTSTAVRRLIRIIYVVMPGTSPPSFLVTTAAAVAVGQIRHNIAPSISTTQSWLETGNAARSQYASRPRAEKRPP